MNGTKVTVGLLGEEVSKWCHQHLNRNDVSTLHGDHYVVIGGDWSVFVEHGSPEVPYIDSESHVELLVYMPPTEDWSNMGLVHRALAILIREGVPVNEARNIRVEITRPLND